MEWKKSGNYFFAGGAHGEFGMKDAALLFDGGGEIADAVAAAADHDHFRTDLVRDMDMGGGEDGFMAVMLKLDQLFGEAALVVVVNHGQRGQDFIIAVPFLPGEFAADEIADEFRAVLIMVFGGEAVKFFEQRRFERETDACDL